ncbi:MAG: hypothetical protein WCD51_00615, partial [Anaerolineae bacterium]
MIESHGFGYIVIDGKRHTSDVMAKGRRPPRSIDFASPARYNGTGAGEACMRFGPRFGSALKWLIPGMGVKRWLLL